MINPDDTCIFGDSQETSNSSNLNSDIIATSPGTVTNLIPSTIPDAMQVVFSCFENQKVKEFREAIFYSLTKLARSEWKAANQSTFDAGVTIPPILLEYKNAQGKTLLELVLETPSEEKLSDEQKAIYEILLLWIGAGVFGKDANNDALQKAFCGSNNDVIVLLVEHYDRLSHYDDKTVWDDSEGQNITLDDDQISDEKKNIAITARARMTQLTAHQDTIANIIEDKNKNLVLAKKAENEKERIAHKEEQLKAEKTLKDITSGYRSGLSSGKKVDKRMGAPQNPENTLLFSPNLEKKATTQTTSKASTQQKATTQTTSKASRQQHAPLGAATMGTLALLAITAILITAYFPDTALGDRTGAMDKMHSDLSDLADRMWDFFGAGNTTRNTYGASPMLFLSGTAFTLGAAMMGAALGAAGSAVKNKK